MAKFTATYSITMYVTAEIEASDIEEADAKGENFMYKQAAKLAAAEQIRDLADDEIDFIGISND